MRPGARICVIFAAWALCACEPAPRRPLDASPPTAAGDRSLVAVTEVEPNDAPEGCQQLSRRSFEDRIEVTGTIGAVDRDEYCLPAGQAPRDGGVEHQVGLPGMIGEAPREPFERTNVEVTLSGAAGCDLALDAHGAGDFHVDGHDVGEAEILPNLGIRYGLAHLVVSAHAGCPAGSAYHLTLKVRARPRPAEEWEPNDSAKEATRLSPGLETRAFLPGPEDRDWFELPIGAPALSRAPRLELKVVPPAAVALAVRVEDPLGGVLLEASGEAGETVWLRGIGRYTWTPRYLAEVRAKTGTAIDAPYRVVVQSWPDERVQEFEPNGTIAQATPLPMSPSPSSGTATMASPGLTGWITALGDLDHFQLVTPRTTQRAVLVERDSEGRRLTLVLLDVAGKELRRCTVGERCGECTLPGALVMPLGASPGRFTFRLEGDPDPATPYRISASFGAPICARSDRDGGPPP